MKKKLADLLSYRKSLEEIRRAVENPPDADFLYRKQAQLSVAQGVDSLEKDKPKKSVVEVLAHSAHVLTRYTTVDSLIQRTNWNTKIDVSCSVFEDFSDTPKQGTESHTLAELLLRRKHLAIQAALYVALSKRIPAAPLVQRRPAGSMGNTEYNTVDYTSSMVDPAQVKDAINHTAQRLREIDSVIQNANWTTEVEVDDELFADYKK